MLSNYAQVNTNRIYFWTVDKFISNVISNTITQQQYSPNDSIDYNDYVDYNSDPNYNSDETYSGYPDEENKYECQIGPFEGFFVNSVEFCKGARIIDGSS